MNTIGMLIPFIIAWSGVCYVIADALGRRFKEGTFVFFICFLLLPIVCGMIYKGIVG